MKKLLFLLLLLSGTTFCFSQKVVYQYDNAGNRVKRFLEIQPAQVRQNHTFKADSVIENTPDFLLKVYPNPTKGALGIEIMGVNNNEKISLILYSPTGAILYNQQGNIGLNSVDITSYTAGIYILKIKVGEKTSDYKIIKQ